MHIRKWPSRSLILSVAIAIAMLGQYDAQAKDAPEWYNKGVELSQSGRYLEAIKCYDKALEIDPNYIP